jgi:hypothetical protein
MHRWRKRRAFKARDPIVAVEKIDARPVLKFQAVEASDLFEESYGLTVAAHEEVLAIIDGVARPGVHERISATAQVLAAFEQEDPPALLAEPNARRKPAESASDYDYAVIRHLPLELTP